jgi:hypothetical protein
MHHFKAALDQQQMQQKLHPTHEESSKFRFMFMEEALPELPDLRCTTQTPPSRPPLLEEDGFQYPEWMDATIPKDSADCGDFNYWMYLLNEVNEAVGSPTLSRAPSSSSVPTLDLADELATPAPLITTFTFDTTTEHKKERRKAQNRKA